MMNVLGAKMSLDNLQAYFQHPCEPAAKIRVFLDACHMIKLVRGSLSDLEVLQNKEGGLIKWRFLDELE